MYGLEGWPEHGPGEVLSWKFDEELEDARRIAEEAWGNEYLEEPEEENMEEELLKSLSVIDLADQLVLSHSEDRWAFLLDDDPHPFIIANRDYAEWVEPPENWHKHPPSGEMVSIDSDALVKWALANGAGEVAKMCVRTGEVEYFLNILREAIRAGYASAGPVVMDLIQSKNPDVAAAGLELVKKLELGVDEIAPFLRHLDQSVREVAFRLLGEMRARPSSREPDPVQARGGNA